MCVLSLTCTWNSSVSVNLVKCMCLSVIGTDEHIRRVLKPAIYHHILYHHALIIVHILLIHVYPRNK